MSLNLLADLHQHLIKEVKSADAQVRQFQRWAEENRRDAQRFRKLFIDAGGDSKLLPTDVVGSDLDLMEELRTAQKDVADFKSALEQAWADRDLHYGLALKNGQDVTEREQLIEELRKEKQQLRLELEELRSASPRDTLKRVALRWLKEK